MQFKDIKIIVALGNQGLKYENTFHNVGVFVLEQFQDLADERGLSGLDFVVLPGFMNQSGLNLYQYLRNSKYGLNNCLLIHDDSDLNLGDYKFSFAKNSAGQRGVQNVINQFGSRNFWRLRIGIRNPNEIERQKASEFVLKKIPNEAKEVLNRVSKDAFSELVNLLS